MALVQINPIEAQVRWDRRGARPTRIRVADRDVAVTGMTARRDELAAYPAERGPRVTLLVETERGQASLVYDGRRRRWFVEAMDTAA